MNSAHGVEKTSELLREVFCGIVTSKDLDGSTKLSFDLSTKVLKWFNMAGEQMLHIHKSVEEG